MAFACVGPRVSRAPTIKRAIQDWGGTPGEISVRGQGAPASTQTLLELTV
jgi:hypothetical protein